MNGSMRYLWITNTSILCSCAGERSPFTEKDHEIIRSEITANYEKNKQAFQELAKEVAAFHIIRSVQFRYGPGMKDIKIYCDSMDRKGDGEVFVVRDLNDARLQTVFDQEQITKATLKHIRQRLDSLHCNSFFTMGTTRGTPYVHIEFQYNDWNGANFYFYKLFDKKMEPEMFDFFDRKKNVVMGSINRTGGVLDSNAVWYLPAD